MTQRDRLGEILVQPQRAGNGARYLTDLQRMRQARAVVVGMRYQEHLRFVLQPAKCTAVYYPVAVALKIRAELVRLLGNDPPTRVGSFAGVFAQRKRLILHDTFSGQHGISFHYICGRAEFTLYI